MSKPERMGKSIGNLRLRDVDFNRGIIMSTS